MQRLVLILTAIAICIGGYLFINVPQSSESLVNNTDALNSSDTEAKLHIQALTQGTDQPIAIEKADNFVTSDQLLNLPRVITQTPASITPDSVSAQTNNDASTYAVTSHLNVIQDQTRATLDKRQTNTSLPQALKNQIKLQELLDDPDQSEQKVYFIHAVNEGDHEGLWGIIQHGLMQTFTTGLTLPGLDKTVTVDIPKEADEKLANKRSSFLGQVLKGKVDKTYIYNYQKGILGDNPHLIKPGQQLIIVTFTEQELMAIYNHFTSL